MAPDLTTGMEHESSAMIINGMQKKKVISTTPTSLTTAMYVVSRTVAHSLESAAIS